MLSFNITRILSDKTRQENDQMTVDARVAVLYPKENELKIEEIAFPSPEPDQVIVKQFASGVCH